MYRRLTDNYNKDEGSVITRLMQLLQEPFEAIPFDRIKMWRGVDDTEGVTLDLIGGNVDQVRGQASDAIYRTMIRAKILRNKSNGTINELVELLSFVLQIDPHEIVLTEGYELEVPLPASIRITDIPATVLTEIGLTPEQLVQIIKSAVAAGVRLEILELTGTFQFSTIDDTTPEQDEDTGFANDDQTLGGYLGEVFSSDNAPDLPA